MILNLLIPVMENKNILSGNEILNEIAEDIHGELGEIYDIDEFNIFFVQCSTESASSFSTIGMFDLILTGSENLAERSEDSRVFVHELIADYKPGKVHGFVVTPFIEQTPQTAFGVQSIWSFVFSQVGTSQSGGTGQHLRDSFYDVMDSHVKKMFRKELKVSNDPFPSMVQRFGTLFYIRYPTDTYPHSTFNQPNFWTGDENSPS